MPLVTTAGPVSVARRSARATTGPTDNVLDVALDVAFVAASVPDPVAPASRVSVWPACEAVGVIDTRTVAVADCPIDRLGGDHVTVEPLVEIVPCVVDADTSVTPAGDE